MIIVGCTDPSKSGEKAGKDYYMLDMGISMEHMVLAAHDRGYGTCWLGGQFDEDVVHGVLEVPDSHRIVALLPVVYPDEEPEARERKPPDELYSWNKW